MSVFDRIIKFNQYQKTSEDVLAEQKLVANAKNIVYLLPPKRNFSFGKRSLYRLNQCHDDIQKVMFEAIQYIDFSVTEGWRSKKIQSEYFVSGTSKVKWPYSYHNTLKCHILDQYLDDHEGSPDQPLSLAIDIAPYPIDYENLERFVKLASIVKLCACKVGVTGLDWGYDLWKWDFPHWQLTSYRKPKNELS